MSEPLLNKDLKPAALVKGHCSTCGFLWNLENSSYSEEHLRTTAFGLRYRILENIEINWSKRTEKVKYFRNWNQTSKSCDIHYMHCVEILCIRIFPGPYFPAFGLNFPECGKIRTRKNPNRDTFQAVMLKGFKKFALISFRELVVLYRSSKKKRFFKNAFVVDQLSQTNKKIVNS